MSDLTNVIANEPILTVDFLVAYVEKNCAYDSSKTIQNHCCKRFWSFLSIQKSIRDNLLNNRMLNLLEQKALSKALKLLENNSAIDQVEKSKFHYHIFTSYSNDYSIGYLCDHINKNYANKHNYSYSSYVDEYSNIISKILPRTHCTWIKVYLLLNYLNDKLYEHIDYFLWIDADAIVVNNTIELDDIVKISKNKNLILSEDVNTCCYINAGVLLVRNNDWSRSFWNDVWNSYNYFDVKHYEQSAIIKCLRMRNEGLNIIKPFHSYIIPSDSTFNEFNATQIIKLFPNVAVLSHNHFNTNSLSNNDQIKFHSMNVSYIDTKNLVDMSSEDNEYYASSTSKRKPNYINIKDYFAPLFIYHPAGCSDKLKYLLERICKYNIDIPNELRNIEKLKLNRSKHVFSLITDESNIENA